MSKSAESLLRLHHAFESRPHWIPKPVNLPLPTGDWAVACDASLLVAIKGHVPDFGELTVTDYEKNLWQLIEAPMQEGRQVTLAALRKFAGEPTWPSEKPCEACKGTGTQSCPICKGTSRTEITCDDCDTSHECRCRHCQDGSCDCDECSGLGRSRVKIEFRYGKICSLSINRESLARALDTVQGELAHIWRIKNGSLETGVLMVDGGDWRICLAQLADAGPICPVFEEEP